jgi:hypothetical protein
MTAHTTYNGWTNRATWLVGAHDFFDFEHVQQAIGNIINGDLDGEDFYVCSGTDSALNPDIVEAVGMERAITMALAKWLENEHEVFLEEETEKLNPYLQDHINGSLWAINWVEIAEHYAEEIKATATAA